MCDHGNMPRHNRSRRRDSSRRRSNSRGSGATTARGGQPDQLNELLGLDPGYRHEEDFDGGWHVRQVAAWRAVKDYTCPGCLRTIPSGVAHLVAWRSDWIFGDEAAGAERRHWHVKCWQNRRQDLR